MRNAQAKGLKLGLCLENGSIIHKNRKESKVQGHRSRGRCSIGKCGFGHYFDFFHFLSEIGSKIIT